MEGCLHTICRIINKSHFPIKLKASTISELWPTGSTRPSPSLSGPCSQHLWGELLRWDHLFDFLVLRNLFGVFILGPKSLDGAYPCFSWIMGISVTIPTLAQLEAVLEVKDTTHEFSLIFLNEMGLCRFISVL